MFFLNSRQVLQAEALRHFAWMEHGFQTRFSQELPDGFQTATLRQVHSSRVFVTHGEGGVLGEGDALVTATPGVLLTIRTADCVPLIVVDPVKRVVAAVHAGWRGCLGGVVPETVVTMQTEFGSRPGDLVVAIGPCIRRDSFEVGAEVAREFEYLFPERFDLHEKTTIDLGEACARQLAAAGVDRTRVADCGYCSFQDAERFHSYRRDREQSGRMVTFVGIRQIA